MWLLDLFSGLGTELGLLNAGLLAIAGFLLRRRFKILKDKETNHDKMWIDYLRRKGSGTHDKLTDKAMLAAAVSQVLKKEKD